MPQSQTLAGSCSECIVWQDILGVDIAFELTGHSEVVEEERPLIDVFKETELPVFQREFKAVLEILVSVNADVFSALFDLFSSEHPYRYLGHNPFIAHRSLNGPDSEPAVHSDLSLLHESLYHLKLSVEILLHIWAVKLEQLLVAPLELGVSELEDALGVIELVGARLGHTHVVAVLLGSRHRLSAVLRILMEGF